MVRDFRDPPPSNGIPRGERYSHLRWLRPTQERREVPYDPYWFNFRHDPVKRSRDFYQTMRNTSIGIALFFLIISILMLMISIIEDRSGVTPAIITALLISGAFGLWAFRTHLKYRNWF